VPQQAADGDFEVIIEHIFGLEDAVLDTSLRIKVTAFAIRLLQLKAEIKIRVITTIKFLAGIFNGLLRL